MSQLVAQPYHQFILILLILSEYGRSRSQNKNQMTKTVGPGEKCPQIYFFIVHLSQCHFHVGEEIFYMIMEKQSSSPLDGLIYYNY